MLPPIKTRANTSASNGESSSVYRATSLCCHTPEPRYWMARRSADANPRRMKLLLQEGLVCVVWGMPLFNRGGRAPAPQAPAAPAVLERQPPGWRSDDSPGIAA